MAKPTHKLTMKAKGNTNSRNVEIGAIWKQDDGDGMSLVLNKGVSISWRDSEDHWFNIWPVGPIPERGDGIGDRSMAGSIDDTIPF